MVFNGVLKKFNGCLRKVSKMFQGYFNVLRKVHNHSKKAFRGLQVSVNGI